MEIYQCRHEAGLGALRIWLTDRRNYANRKWPSAKGDELAEYQGEARTLRKLLELIEEGPAIKETQSER